MNHTKLELSLLSRLTPRDISTILLTSGLVLIFFLPSDNLLHGHTSYCIHKYLFNFQCPGCGMTRALNQLLHGEFRQALIFNIGIIPFAVFIIQQYFSYVLPEQSNEIFRKFSIQFLTSSLLIIYAYRIAQYFG
jgi:hypothetical protein